jgi:DNA polymerase-3 subunit delta
MNTFLIGTQRRLIERRLQEIIRQAVGDDDMNVSRYSGGDWAWEDLMNDLVTVPFLGGRKVVVLWDPDFLGAGSALNEDQLAALTAFLDHPSDTTELVVAADQDVDKKRKVYGLLTKKMKTERFEAVSGQQFEAIVLSDLAQRHLALDAAARQELFSRLGGDLDRWYDEWDKLSLYPGKLDREAIRALVVRPLEDNVFELSNAVAAKDMGKAVAVYHDLLVNNRNDIAGLTGLLAAQFRFMAQVKNRREQGETIDQIAGRYGCKPYRVKMSLKAAQGTSSRQLLKILSDLSDLDLASKTGRVNAQLGLELFIMEACRR